MTNGEKVIAFLEFLKVPEGAKVGQHIVLEDFQKKFIKDIYDNPDKTKTAILSIARKNGKTALIAGLLLAHLVGPVAVQNSQIISGAMSREQAALVFKLAHKMIMQSPELSGLVKAISSAKTLIGLPMNVEYRAVAADGTTAQGLSPVLVIFDECGQITGSRNDFYDALLTSQGAHINPLMINISTQAPNEDDLLSIMIDDYRKHKDPHTVCHVYEAPDDCDLLDKKAWKKANPALGSFRSLEDMTMLAEKANRMPSFENKFRNLNLNQRVNPLSPFVSKSSWMNCSGEVLEDVFLNNPVYGGLDLSERIDLTAFAMVARDKNTGILYSKMEFWTPAQTIGDRSKRDRAPYDVWAKQGFMTATPGSSVDYAVVAERIVELNKIYNFESIAFDRYRINALIAELGRLGIQLPLKEWGQGFKDATVAIEALETEILNNRFIHSNHPVLNLNVHNARVVMDPAGSRKFDKSKATGRIDGIVALAMAVGVAGTLPVKREPSIHFI